MSTKLRFFDTIPQHADRIDTFARQTGGWHPSTPAPAYEWGGRRFFGSASVAHPGV